MTQAARVYGGSLYDLAAEEKLDGQIMEQMNEIRQIFRENPGYLKLLGEPAIPQDERMKLLDEAFGGQAEPYLLNFLKLLCEKKAPDESLRAAVRNLPAGIMPTTALWKR